MKKIWALVPIKDFADAKTRLAAALPQNERRALAAAMAHDVVAALVNSGVLERVVIVSDIPEVVDVLDIAGTELFHTGQACGLNQDLAAAADWACRQGASHILVTHADLPFLTPAAIAAFIRGAETNGANGKPAIRAAASRDGRGTNILLAPLPLPLPFLFGPDSLNRFRTTARTAGIGLEVVCNPSLANDIDEMEDYHLLVSACDHGKLADSATANYLFAKRTSMPCRNRITPARAFDENAGLPAPGGSLFAASQ